MRRRVDWRSAGARALRRFRLHACLDRAAVVAFYSLLSLAPLVYLIGLLARRAFPGPRPVLAVVLRLSPFLPAEAASALARLIEHDLTAAGPVIVLALPGLAWAATAGLRALERSINEVFRATGTRNLCARLRGLLLLGALVALLGLAIVADELVRNLAGLREALGLGAMATPVGAVAYRAVQLTVTFVLLFLVYFLLPRRGASAGAALAGALVALPLWEIGRRVFGAMIGLLPNLGLLSGTLAGIVVLQLWIYACAAIVLLGAEFAAEVAADVRRGVP